MPFIAASFMSGACAGGCPYGMVNCPYPGQCPRYVDLNGDGLCDLSQTVTTTTTDTSSSLSSDPSTSTQVVDDRGHGIHNIQNVDSDPSNISVTQDPGGLDTSSSSVDGQNYHILPISLLIIGGYLFTHYLFKKGILKPQKHFRIWNLLLVIGYLGTGLTGVFLTFIINLGIYTIYNSSINYWHAELSILMVIGTLVHLHLYRRPFKNMFKVLFGFKSNSKKKNNTKSMNLSK